MTRDVTAHTVLAEAWGLDMTKDSFVNLGSLASADLLDRARPRMTERLNPAQWMYKRLVEHINDFEEKLDKEHEIGARMVNLSGQSFYIEDMGFHGPDLVMFYGTNGENEPVQLLQHVSQVNVLLIAMKKRHDRAKRIGFGLRNEEPANGE